MARYFRKISDAAARHIHKKSILLRRERAIISFTFDDIPASAAAAGASIIEKHNLTATYYVATGLLGTTDLHCKYASHTDIRALYENGHHVAAHTHSHVSLRYLSSHEIMREICENGRSLSALTGMDKISHFSFPLGQMSIKAKKILRSHYSTIRGSRPGINVGSIDLAALFAVPIYERFLRKKSIREYIVSVVEQKGWLIFYTHDVDSRPSPWGVTPTLLEFAVRASLQSGAEVLNVADAFERLQPGCP